MTKDSPRNGTHSSRDAHEFADSQHRMVEFILYQLAERFPKREIAHHVGCKEPEFGIDFDRMIHRCSNELVKLFGVLHNSGVVVSYS